MFTLSLGDFYDNQVPARWRDDAWHRIDQTPNLDWMMLTKRPQNIPKMLPDRRTGVPAWGEGWRNVWLGTTVEDRARLINVEHLRRVPARIRFLSIKPLLEDLGRIDLSGIDLVITGEESGPRARVTPVAAFESIRDQCRIAGTAYFHKQNGEFLPSPRGMDYRQGEEWALGLATRFERLTDGHTYARVGRARAGRLLGGRTHDEMPERRS